MAAVDQWLTAILLLSVLSCVLLTGMFLAFLILRWRHAQGVSEATQAPGQPVPDSLAECPHLALKRPTSWLAIKHHDPLAVQAALALHNPKPCLWSEGLSTDGDQKLFVSPPVS